MVVVIVESPVTLIYGRFFPAEPTVSSSLPSGPITGRLPLVERDESGFSHLDELTSYEILQGSGINNKRCHKTLADSPTEDRGL